ncbi:MAG TPA: tRNA pseudouridine(55) synthase TruB [Candidatus Paceibacterota bacterium]|nr:tRNA pseudouridine(55) synthase TruB [Candidatus Paceibacterota bacterium]
MSVRLLLIDKPKGITSFDVIRRLRRELGVRKMGHAGTLDPLATGLLLVGVGEGTKDLTKYVGLDKEYLATVRIGERRTTGDLEGAIVEEKEVTELREEDVCDALSGMVGTLRLPVSPYSAVKQGGVRLYKRARKAEKRGEVIEDTPLRDMVVHEADFLDMKCESGRAEVRVRFKVGSGTYVRSLGEEIGRRLGYPATLADLRRTKVGDFSVEDARAL